DGVLAAFLAECGSVDPKQLGGGGTVMLAMVEDGAQDRRLGELEEPLVELGILGTGAGCQDFLPRPCRELALDLAARGHGGRRDPGDGRQVFPADPAAAREDCRVLDRVAQLADIALPGARAELCQDVVAEPDLGDVRQARLPQEVFGQGGDVVAPAAEWRGGDLAKPPADAPDFPAT